MYKLLQGDCVELLKKIPDNSIDMCIADIPYGIDYSYWDTLHKNNNSALGKGSKHQLEDTSFKRRGKPINGWSSSDKKIPYEYQAWCEQWAKELFRITKQASPILIFSSRRFQHRVANALEDNGFMIRDILIWQKNKCNPKAQRINNILEKRNIITNEFNDYRVGNLAPYYEPIIYAMKPYKHTLTDCILENKIGGFYCKNNKIPSNIIYCPVNKRNLYHETEKPTELIRNLIEIFSIDNNHTILDFCMGSGSTGVACINTNRNFIGIELDKNYYDIANKRIEEAKNASSFCLQ
jgi:site-specific DNA-methyltransferase (adenine-specific)